MPKTNPSRIFFLLLALACLVFAYLNYPCAKKFNNPIGFTFNKGIFFVLEKQGNTILEFKSPRPGRSLRIMNSFRTRSDDNNYFYMARVLFPSPLGIMVKSVIYDRNSGDSCGYSFEEYSVFEKDVHPVEILRVLFGTSEDYPEFSYACDKDGNHYFVNNMPGHRNIWKIAAGGSAFVDRGIRPANIREMGEENSDMSSWMNICIGDDGRIYATNGATGRITTYSSEGGKTGEEVVILPVAPLVA